VRSARRPLAKFAMLESRDFHRVVTTRAGQDLFPAITVARFRRGDGWACWASLVVNTIAFGAVMTYDWTVDAIGPFEMSEYIGIAAIYGALAVTAPFLRAGWPRQSIG